MPILIEVKCKILQLCSEKLFVPGWVRGDLVSHPNKRDLKLRTGAFCSEVRHRFSCQVCCLETIWVNYLTFLSLRCHRCKMGVMKTALALEDVDSIKWGNAWKASASTSTGRITSMEQMLQKCQPPGQPPWSPPLPGLVCVQQSTAELMLPHFQA